MSRRSQLFRRDLRWRFDFDTPEFLVSASTRSWLREQRSLTARLRLAFGPAIAVRVLRQQWDRPFPSEALALGLPLTQRALIREVELSHGGIPLILARSVIPAEALSGAQCRLASLGNRPLGDLLFRYRRVRRETLEFAAVKLPGWRTEIVERTGLNGEIWGRRSRYRVMKGCILVAEFFLAAVTEQR